MQEQRDIRVKISKNNSKYLLTLLLKYDIMNYNKNLVESTKGEKQL